MKDERTEGNQEANQNSRQISPCRLQMLFSLAGRLAGVGTSTGGNASEPQSDAETSVSVQSEDRPESSKDRDRDLCYIQYVNFSTYEIQCWYPSPYPLDGLSAEGNKSIKNPQVTCPKGRFSLHKAACSDPTAPNFSPITLYVCHKCFKYCLAPIQLSNHKKRCSVNKPPGKVVYRRGSISIFEVDGLESLLYCQNLALFGKLFLDQKYVFYDLDGFKFYVLTDAKPPYSLDHVVGFFSKEKISYEDYNLACIVTFPPFQKMGYGALMIEFSYELSKREFKKGVQQKVGTPERPLTDLGLRGYVLYWTSVLIRYFRSQFERLNHHHKNGDVQQVELNGYSNFTNKRTSKRPRRESAAKAIAETHEDSNFNITQQQQEKSGGLVITIEQIAEATMLRTDDVALALLESGLASRRRKVSESAHASATIATTTIEIENESASSTTTATANSSPSNNTNLQDIVITPDLIDQVVIQLRIREPLLDPAYCIL